MSESSIRQIDERPSVHLDLVSESSLRQIDERPSVHIDIVSESSLRQIDERPSVQAKASELVLGSGSARARPSVQVKLVS